jgi:hypothetical protein
MIGAIEDVNRSVAMAEGGAAVSTPVSEVRLIVHVLNPETVVYPSS